jgi:hypothetical protein
VASDVPALTETLALRVQVVQVVQASVKAVQAVQAA